MSDLDPCPQAPGEPVYKPAPHPFLSICSFGIRPLLVNRANLRERERYERELAAFERAELEWRVRRAPRPADPFMTGFLQPVRRP